MSTPNDLKKFMSKMPNDSAKKEALRVAYSQVLRAIPPKSKLSIALPFSATVMIPPDRLLAESSVGKYEEAILANSVYAPLLGIVIR